MLFHAPAHLPRHPSRPPRLGVTGGVPDLERCGNCKHFLILKEIITPKLACCRFARSRDRTPGPAEHAGGEIASGSGRPDRSERLHGERDSNGIVQREDWIQQVGTVWMRSSGNRKTGYVSARFIILIAQFRVTIATRCINVSYLAERERASSLSVSVSVGTDNILIWICEV